MKSLVISAILLSFSAGFSAEPDTVHFKTSTTCAGCIKNVDKAVCQKFKADLSECRQEVGHLWVKGKNLNVETIKKAVEGAGYTAEPAQTKN